MNKNSEYLREGIKLGQGDPMCALCNIGIQVCLFVCLFVFLLFFLFCFYLQGRRLGDKIFVIDRR